MSEQAADERLGKVETEMARMGARQERLERDVMEIGSGVKSLLERDARRPEGLSGAKIAATAMTTLTLLAGFAWLTSAAVEHAPAVVALKERMDHAEWKYGWAARVDR